MTAGKKVELLESRKQARGVIGPGHQLSSSVEKLRLGEKHRVYSSSQEVPLPQGVGDSPWLQGVGDSPQLQGVGDSCQAFAKEHTEGLPGICS